jgi:hypothetical protein
MYGAPVMNTFVELRIDSADGQYYTLESFLEAYGRQDGLLRWDKASSTSAKMGSDGHLLPVGGATSSSVNNYFVPFLALSIIFFSTTTEDELTKQLVDDVFEDDVAKETFEKLRAVLKVFLYMRDEGIARFDVNEDGAFNNVFGFWRVHVMDRSRWDLCMMDLARDLQRKFKNGRTIKEPASCIYEIFKQCGMDVVRTKGRHPAHLPPGQKKSLKQDTYVFNPTTFRTNKYRATVGGRR